MYFIISPGWQSWIRYKTIVFVEVSVSDVIPAKLGFLVEVGDFVEQFVGGGWFFMSALNFPPGVIPFTGVTPIFTFRFNVFLSSAEMCLQVVK